MNQRLVTLLACLAITAFATHAQNPGGGKNVIKVNLSSIALDHYGLQYERVTGKKQSIAIGFGISPNVDLPFKSNLLDQFEGNADAKTAIESTKFTKITITPEYRFYLGKKEAPAGFYVAPFIRYTYMNLSQDYKFTPSSNKPHTAHLEGKFSGIGGGILLGAQWMLGRHVTLDWWIVGPFYGVMKSDFHGTDDMSDMSAQDKADLESDIESVDLPLWEVDATVGNNVVDAKLKGPFYGVRAFGISLGYRF
jgi:hypothetical protein